MILTDVIVTKALPAEVHNELAVIGLDYLCKGSEEDFRGWMTSAGLIDVNILDLTPTLRMVWEYRREADRIITHQQGYAYLLDDPLYGLGQGIFYIYVRGEKPKTSG